MNLTTETQIWLQEKNIEVKKRNRTRSPGKTTEYFQAIIDFGENKEINGKMFRYDKAEGKSEKEAIQKLCDENGILSFWEIAQLKTALQVDMMKKWKIDS